MESAIRGLRKRVAGPSTDVSAAVQVYPGPLRESIIASQKLDALQIAMEKLPQIEMPVTHVFTPGLYTRRILNPAGTLIVTKIHKTEHPYNVSKGTLSVWIDGVGLRRVEAPYAGITLPGTRRIIYAWTDVVLTTYHANPTNETDLSSVTKQKENGRIT